MKTSILIVEDDESIAGLIEFLLRREGYEVILAKDGLSAKRQISESPPPDLVLLDIMLPYIDGIHLLELIKNLPTWSQVPVIMLTVRSAESVVAKALEIGAEDFIAKPFQPMELVARVNRRLKQKKVSR